MAAGSGQRAEGGGVRADNDLLRHVDDGLDAARGIFAGVALSVVLLTLGALIGAALFGNP